MSIMDTLITDRTQADADAMNEKGTYTAIDLNRVGDAMEYLHDLFESYGYSMPNYKRIKLARPGHYEIHTITKPILPDGYTQLEYIESTGTQYIDTRVSGGTNASFEMTARLVSTNSKNNNQFFGTVSNFCSVNGTSSYFRVEKKNSTGAVVNFTTTPATKWNLKVESDGSVYLGGALKGTISSIAGIGWGGDTYSNNIFITDDDGINYATSAELYLLKMYTDGVLVRDFVPAKRLSDNAIGLYDIATNSFFSNSGTGTFTAGPENIEYETITEEVFSTDERDPYTWFQDDIPTPSIMDQYLTNLSELRSLFVQAATTPPVPPDMEWFTFQEANDIEKILVDIEDMVRRIEAAYLFSGDVFAGEV